jgi:hypothetical protein
VFLTFQESTFEKAKSWLPYLNELSPPIQILVCEACFEENGKNIIWLIPKHIC